MLKEALRDCVGGMPHGLGEHIGREHVYAVMKSAEVEKLMSELEEKSEGAVDEEMIREVQTHLDGLVISEIDKARGELCIM